MLPIGKTEWRKSNMATALPLSRGVRNASQIAALLAKEQMLGSSLLGSSQAGPASACVKVLRSVIKDNSQHCMDKSAGVLIVQAEPPVSILRSARQQSRTDIDQFDTRIDLSAEKML